MDFNGYTNNSRSNSRRSNNFNSNNSNTNTNSNNNSNTRRLKRSFGKRNLFSHIRNNTNAKWTRFGKYRDHVQFTQQNANGNTSPQMRTPNQYLYNMQLKNSRKSNTRRTPLRTSNIGLSPIQAKMFANIASSTNSFNEMAEKVVKLPISTESKEKLLKHIEFLKQ